MLLLWISLLKLEMVVVVEGVVKFLAEPGLVTATSGLLAGGEVLVGAAWLELVAALLLSFNLRFSLFFLLKEGGWNLGEEL